MYEGWSGLDLLVCTWPLTGELPKGKDHILFTSLFPAPDKGPDLWKVLPKCL